MAIGPLHGDAVASSQIGDETKNLDPLRPDPDGPRKCQQSIGPGRIDPSGSGRLDTPHAVNMKHLLRSSFLALAVIGLTANAYAVTDAQGDFLHSFTGNPGAALDILSANVTFDAAHDTFLLRATTAGPIAGANGAGYVFGFNTGGTANTPFAAIGEPGVAFNATALLKSNGTGAVGAAAVSTHIVGDEIFATVPASLLPSHGFADPDYTWALWSIDTNVAGLPRNADFAPDANVRVSAVPEPANVALLAAGFGLLGFVARRRARVTAR